MLASRLPPTGRAPPSAKASPRHGSSHLTRCAQPLGRGPGERGREGKRGRSRRGGEAGGGGTRGPRRVGCIPHTLPTLVRFPPSSPDWPSPALRVLAQGEKSAHFPPSRGDRGRSECSESPLISGLGKTGSDLFIFGNSPEKQALRSSGVWLGKGPTSLKIMAPAPLLGFLGLKFGLFFFLNNC